MNARLPVRSRLRSALRHDRALRSDIRGHGSETAIDFSAC